MITYVVVAAVAAVAFIVLDLVWFYFAGDFFKSEISSIARLTPAGDWNIRLLPALLVYALMGMGVSVFVETHASGLAQAVGLGALFGLIGYGLYDLTNLATLADWTVRFTVVDMLWGTFLCGAVSGIAYLVAQSFV